MNVHVIGKTLLLAVLLGISLIPSSATNTSPLVNAQSGSEAWSQPENLSRSGSTTIPQTVIDNEGGVHVVWLDEFAGPVYSKKEGEGWLEPQAFAPPFDLSTTVLIPDSAGKIYAFWVDVEDDTEDTRNFYYSVTLANNFVSGWGKATWLGESVQDFDVAFGEDNNLHLVYVRALQTAEFLAGVYYRRVSINGGQWSAPQALYKSPYLRTITPENANLEIDTEMVGDQERVYVVWDNPLRKNIFFAKSIDGGVNWDPAITVQAPNLSPDAPEARNVKIASEQGSVLLVWQEAVTETNCQQYYQVSSDGGDTWGFRQRMLQKYQGCPQNNHLFEYQAKIILQTSLLNQPHFIAWNGSQWSEPQPQSALLNFRDPETNQLIDFQCLNSSVNGVELYMVGCDAGTGGDTWVTHLSLETVDAWFPSLITWSRPASVVSNIASTPSFSLVADRNGRIHTLWSQPGTALAGSPSSAIHYAQWDGERWTVSSAVLASLPGRARQLTTIVDSRDRLLLFWIGGPSGEVFFSWANTSLARTKSEWSTPTALPAPGYGVSSLEARVDDQGVIHVVYAIPLNENRGIYLTQSSDQGKTWSEPVRVFDGAKAGWDLVDQPHLTVAKNGWLHLTLTQFTLPGGDGPIGLYYIRSEDGGKTWVGSQQIANSSVQWSEIQSTGDAEVHRIWQENWNSRPIIRFDVSRDNGLTWNRLSNITVLGSSSGVADLAMDWSGYLHLVQLSGEVTGELVLKEWSWDGESWNTRETIDLGTGDITQSILASGITPQGFLATMVYKLGAPSYTTQKTGEFIFTGRNVDLNLQASNP